MVANTALGRPLKLFRLGQAITTIMYPVVQDSLERYTRAYAHTHALCGSHSMRCLLHNIGLAVHSMHCLFHIIHFV